MTKAIKYTIEPNEQFPDSSHHWWLRKDQYVIGELLVSEEGAIWIAAALNVIYREQKGSSKLEEKDGKEKVSS